MDAQPTPADDRVALNGFSKESTELIREMEEFGWTFRLSNHGVVGRAPDGRTTTSVPRNLSLANRSMQNAYAPFKRWLKARHPEAVEVAADLYAAREEADQVAESNPVIAEILRGRSARRTAERIAQIADPVVRDRFNRARTAETEGETAVPEIVKTEQWKPRGSGHPGRNIARVTERTWSTGRIDYVCAFVGCTYTSRNPRSVSQHYGAAHTRDETAAIAALEAVGEPTNGDGDITTSDEVEAEAVPEMVSAETPGSVSDDEGAPAEAAEPTAEPESVPYSVEQFTVDAALINDNPAVMVAAIQGIVSRPLLEQISRLDREVKFLAGENDKLFAERDAALAELGKIKSDLDALRSLVAGIGRSTA